MGHKSFESLSIRFWMRREAYDSLRENSHEGVQLGMAAEPALLQNLRMIYPYSSSELRICPDIQHFQHQTGWRDQPDRIDEWVAAEISYDAINRLNGPQNYSTMRELQATAMMAMNPELQPHYKFGDFGEIPDGSDVLEISSAPCIIQDPQPPKHDESQAMPYIALGG